MTGWSRSPLGNVATLQRGFDLPSRLRRPGCVPIVSSSGVTGWHDQAVVKAPGVVTGRYGTIGEVFYQSVDFWPLNTTLWVSNFHGNNERFVHYLLQRVNFSAHSGKSGVPGVNRNDLHTEFVELPDSPVEQSKIAHALSDCDASIACLRRLIAKRRAVRQGMMQQLLTGSTRLTGYKEPWQTLLLGDVARIKTGSRNNQDKKASGQYPFFVRSATVERIDSYSYDCEAILVPGEGGVGSIFHYINGKFEVHQRVYKISHFSGTVVGKFIYYYMQMFFGRHAMKNSMKATVDSIRLPTFRAFDMKIPSSPREQMAIVALLDNASCELEVLNMRLVKAKAIKQGMMQELLTGRTRLPVEATS